RFRRIGIARPEIESRTPGEIADRERTEQERRDGNCEDRLERAAYAAGGRISFHRIPFCDPQALSPAVNGICQEAKPARHGPRAWPPFRHAAIPAPPQPRYAARELPA